MSNLETRIALQRSRFMLIQEATDYDELGATRSNRQLINARLEMLDQNWNKFQDKHENLCLTVSENLSNNPYMKERIFERCQAFYVYARANLHTHLEEFDSTERQSRSTFSENGVSASLMPRSAFPRIKLSSFSGDYQSWRPFYDLFASLIKDNPNMTNVEKIHYLKTCLSGEAARLVSTLSISEDNFSIAWNLLTSRYENKRFLIAAQLDRIIHLKPLKTKNAQGLRNLLTTLSETIASLRSLGCAVDSWDPLLLHHVIKILDPESREAWEVKLGSSITYPTFSQFEEFLIGRTRAMENLGLSTNNETPNANVLNKHRNKVAAHVSSSTPNSNFLTCPLCNMSHHLSRCERYQSKTVNQRKDIVIKHRRCFNCLAPHPAKKCNSTKRCLKCGKKHHTSIYESYRDSSSTNSTTTPTKKTINQSNTEKPDSPQVAD